MPNGGIDPLNEVRGGIAGIEPIYAEPPREITLFQRSKGKVGSKLGKTTGWVHRLELRQNDVKYITNVHYDKIDDDGLHYTINGKEQQVLEVDNVVMCAGQKSNNDLGLALKEAGLNVHVIGGASKASELDAKQAINEAAYLAASI